MHRNRFNEETCKIRYLFLWRSSKGIKEVRRISAKSSLIIIDTQTALIL